MCVPCVCVPKTYWIKLTFATFKDRVSLCHVISEQRNMENDIQINGFSTQSKNKTHPLSFWHSWSQLGIIGKSVVHSLTCHFIKGFPKIFRNEKYVNFQSHYILCPFSYLSSSSSLSSVLVVLRNLFRQCFELVCDQDQDWSTNNNKLIIRMLNKYVVF